MNRPTEGELLSVSQPVLDLAMAYEIDSQPVYVAAADELKAIKRKAKDLEAQRKAITQPLDQTKKEVMALFKKPLEMLGEAEAVIKRSMLAYQSEQQRIANDAEAKARASADAERQRMEAQAKAAADAGNTAEANALEQAAQTITAVAPPKAAAPDGISTRTYWKAEVTDKAAFLRFALDHPEMLELISIDTSPLTKQAQANKADIGMPGIRVTHHESISARAA